MKNKNLEDGKNKEKSYTLQWFSNDNFISRL